MAVQIRSDRTFTFGAPRAAVWHALHSVDAYTSWWPWLRHLDATALAVDEIWHCAIQPPLPYTIRCTIHLHALDPSRMVAATVAGDIHGDARVELADDPAGTRVRLLSQLAPSGSWAALGARLAPRVARWGHDRVIRAAADQFAAALTRPAGVVAAGGVAARDDGPDHPVGLTRAHRIGGRPPGTSTGWSGWSSSPEPGRASGSPPRWRRPGSGS